MNFYEQDPETLDLSNRPQHLLSPATGNEDDEETFTTEDEDEHQQSMEEHTEEGQETSGYGIKKITYDSGFVDTSDENNDLGAMGNNSSLVVKQERSRHHYHHHSTPLRPQQIHPHIRHPSTSSSTCSSTSHHRNSQLQQSHSPEDDKECRNTRFLGSRAVAVLNQWFQTNRDYPYPDDERTDRLASEAGITQKQVKKWFANKRVRSQMCYKPLYRSRKSRASSSLTTTSTAAAAAPVVRQSQTSAPQQPVRRPQTNYNYIINHNNIAAQPPSLLPDFGHLFSSGSPPTSNPALFNPMAASMMMFMMQQHFMTTMMAAAGLPQLPPPVPGPSAAPDSIPSSSSTKPNTDRISRFWL